MYTLKAHSLFTIFEEVSSLAKLLALAEGLNRVYLERPSTLIHALNFKVRVRHGCHFVRIEVFNLSD